VKIAVLDSLDALGPERWGGLARQSDTSTAFLTWPWQRQWAAAFAPDQHLRVLTATDAGGALAGVLPLYQDRDCAWHDGDGCSRIVGGVDVSDYLDALIARGQERAVWDALLAHCAATRGAWELRGIRDASPTRELVAALAPAHGLRAEIDVEERCPVLPLPGSWDAYLAGLRGKDRHELKRKTRRLEAELAGSHVRQVTAGDGWSAALGEFLVLHRASRVGKAKFMDERMERFFRAALEALAAEGVARLWFLDAADGPVASFVCLEHGDSVGLYNSGFDPARARLAPGIVLLGHLIRDAIERGKRVFDFLRGEEAYKYDFGPTPRDLYRIRLSGGSA
jgi:CelD/BcsL family acetyltransferase involved in cellulose biosynthesis